MNWLTTVTKKVKIALEFLALCGFPAGCAAPAVLDRPPETYRGHMAEQPLFQQGDYWVYQHGDSSRTKINTLATTLGFPLWIGKTWAYDWEAMPRGRNDPKSGAPRTPVRIDCQVTRFQQLSVRAGTFGSFECECQCKTLSVAYEPDCGEWTVWYAPEVKNILRTTVYAPTGALELIEYKAAR